MEIGNDQAMHGTEPPEPLELIVDARMQFDMLAAVGVLTKAQASSILRLLESGGETLSPADRAFRKNIIRYLKKEADFVTVFAEMLQIDPAVEHPGTKSKGDKRTDSPVSPKPKRDPSIEPATPRQRAAKTFLLSLPPVNTSILPVLIAAGAVLLAAYAASTPGGGSIFPETRAKRVRLDADAISAPRFRLPPSFPPRSHRRMRMRVRMKRPSIHVTINSRRTGKPTPMAA